MTSRKAESVKITFATSTTPAMSENGETEKERSNLTVQEFAAQLKASGQEVRELVKLARKVGSVKSGQQLRLPNGELFGAKELNALTSSHIKTLKQLKKNYTARGTKKKRVPKAGAASRAGKGFNQASFLEAPLVNFLRSANLGNVPNTNTPLREVLKPVLDNNVLSRGILTPLLTIYEFHNNLRFEQDKKKFFRAGPDMEKYLGPYLTALEASDRAKTDAQMMDKNGKAKMRFDRNRFVYNRLQSIVNPGFKKQDSLTAEESAWASLPEVEQTLAQIQSIVSAALTEVQK
jgi:hypothetical protein